MHSHLVTVKVSVECSTYQRMQLDSFSFYQLRLECLDTESVQRRSTVEQNRMSFQNVFKNIPYDSVLAVYNFFSTLNGLNNTTLYHLADDKRFEEFCSHIFRQAALVQFQFRSYNNNRTRRIVDTFTEQVLTKTSLFSLQ